MDIYRRVLEKNADGKPFVLHDGPPYANGPIHIGHAFNKILKDFVVKSHAQRGYFTPYIPGWDCHGQPIEHMVEVTLGPEKMAEISQVELRQRCREWAEKYVDIQRNGFKRLGVNADWEHPYLTFIPNYEAGNVEIFKDLYLKGSVYRGRKPIHWCTHCHTALAEAEIEYSDEVSPSIYVKFKLDAMPGVFEASGAEGDAYLLIWTTTPWTLPANTAVSLAPDADYVMVTVGGDNLIMAKELVETVAEVAGWEDYDFVRGADGEPVALTGKQLFGLTYTAPVRRDIKGTVIYGDHVTLDTGTGAVHTAPGHGQDDYLVALEFDIPMLMPVDDNGVFTGEAGQFAGLSTDEANPGHHRLAARAGDARGREEDQPLLPALLALPRAGHLPRHGPVVRLHGQERPARGRPARHQLGSGVDSRLGQEPHRCHGGRPPRLVHLAPAQLGRAHSRVQVRQVRQHGGHGRDLRRGDRAVQHQGRRRLVHRGAERVSAARHQVRGVRGHRAHPREGHPGRVVGVRRLAHERLPPPRREPMASPSRPTCTWRAPTSTAAGSSRRCSPPSAPTECRRTSRSCTAASPWTKKAARCRSRSATASIRRRCATSSAPTCCASGCPPAITPRTCPSPRTS